MWVKYGAREECVQQLRVHGALSPSLYGMVSRHVMPGGECRGVGKDYVQAHTLGYISAQGQRPEMGFRQPLWVGACLRGVHGLSLSM